MKLFELVNPRYWTNLNSRDAILNDNLRRDILFSQIIITGLIISVIHATNDYLSGNREIFIVDLIFIFILIIFYFLNEKGAHRLTKFLNLIVLNILIFILAAVVDKKTNMSYNFFPLLILAFLVFYKSEFLLSLLFSAFSLILLFILEITDHQPFGDISLKKDNNKVTLLINVIGSFALSVLGLIFLVRTNQLSENEQQETERSLRKANAELDQFVYSVSHDLRAPLKSMQGLINLMKYDAESEKIVDYINKIDDRIIDLDEFIDEIIDCSRTSRSEVVIEEIMLDEFVDDIIEKLHYLDKADGIDFRKEILAKCIKSDSLRLGIILTNILSNAIKYSDDDKSEKWVKISSDETEQSYVIEVEDNGVGIEKEYIDRVFEMFYRASDISDGSGLGLYIVNESIQKISGSIKLESELGKGSKVLIFFPKNRV